MKQGPKRVSVNSSILLKNTRDQVELEQLFIRLAKYNVFTSLIYKYFRKEILRGFKL